LRAWGFPTIIPPFHAATIYQTQRTDKWELRSTQFGSQNYLPLFPNSENTVEIRKMRCIFKKNPGLPLTEILRQIETRLNGFHWDSEQVLLAQKQDLLVQKCRFASIFLMSA
jgi:hypothetical protein